MSRRQHRFDRYINEATSNLAGEQDPVLLLEMLLYKRREEKRTGNKKENA
jgi:hypothetical protein